MTDNKVERRDQRMYYEGFLDGLTFARKQTEEDTGDIYEAIGQILDGLEDVDKKHKALLDHFKDYPPVKDGFRFAPWTESE